VAGATGTYAGRGVVKDDDGPSARGSQRAPVRTRLDSAGRLRPGARAAIPGHAVAWGRPWREQAPVLRPGDLRLADRGVVAGATLAEVQRQRQVEGLRPLTANLRATQEAIPLAERADEWQTHPARAAQNSALGRGGEQRWAACAVPLNAWGLRWWTQQKKCPAHLVWVTPALTLHAPCSVRPSAERPEIAPADAQRTSGGGQRKQRSAPRERAIVVSVLTGVWRDRLYPLFANTQRGARCADKTRQALAFEPLRPQRPPILVYAGGAFDILEPLHVVPLGLPWAPPGQEPLRAWLSEHLNPVHKRE